MTQTTFPQTPARMDGKRGAPLGNQNARLPILNFARKPVLSLVEGPALSFVEGKGIGIVFPYFQNFGPFLALEVDITLETNPLLRHDAAPPLNVISRLMTVFTTPKKRLMSSGEA